MDHWKFGDGFAIRYGGYRDIEWYHGDEFVRGANAAAIPSSHPAALIAQAMTMLGLVLIWWEMRKQNQLVAAEFEERRLLWVVDMLTVWGADIANGNTMRLDSTQYLERELSRLMHALLRTPKMDVPAV